MKIGLVGLPGCGKSTVFGALTGIAVKTGYESRSGKANLGVVKVSDPRVDALAEIFTPRTERAIIHIGAMAAIAFIISAAY